MLVIAILTTVLMIFVGYKLLQMLQLTGYKIKGFNMWLKETKLSYPSRLFMLSFLSVAAITFCPFSSDTLNLAGFSIGFPSSSILFKIISYLSFVCAGVFSPS